MTRRIIDEIVKVCVSARALYYIDVRVVHISTPTHFFFLHLQPSELIDEYSLAFVSLCSALFAGGPELTKLLTTQYQALIERSHDNEATAMRTFMRVLHAVYCGVANAEW